MSRQSVITWLSKNKLANVNPLKILQQYGSKVTLHWQETGQGAMAVIVLKTADSHSFASLYPQTKLVMYVISDWPVMIHQVLNSYQTQLPFVVVFSDETVKSEAETVFDLEFKRSYLSYTANQLLANDQLEQVSVNDGIDPEAREAFFKNEYSDSELDRFVSWGAKSVILKHVDQVTSACFIFPNYENVWEIAGLGTSEEFRHLGGSSAIICRAANYIREQGNSLRYQVDSTDTDSIKLAESLGLERFLVLSHYVATATKPAELLEDN